MTFPTPAVINRFLLVVLGVLLADKLARVALFDGAREDLGGLDVVVAITVAVVVAGSWLRRSTST
ncbi:hypothetical protein [Novosphingobium sp.]|uniref:hypothetical protein n=1 Tax=Novosphingobium sp. TaxID=1874826 RepID=UPI0025D5A96A|nr:hypothetical protein [Novosphingobium sp.]